MEELKQEAEQKHDPSRWHEKVFRYYPVHYDPREYHKLTSWWLDKIHLLGDKIMEVGCWSGLALACLKMTFPEKDIIGCDINPHVVHMARTRMYYLNLDIPIYYEDGFNLRGYENQSKDVIFSDGLLEHFDEENRIKLLNESLRVAKKVLVVLPVKEQLEKGGGYGDERRLNYLEWSEFFNKYFIVGEEFTNDPLMHYACILQGVKNEN